MSGEKKFTRIPPESTGDRVYMVHTAEIGFKDFNVVPAGSTDHVWKTGELYDISGFGGNGKVHVHGDYVNGETGLLAVHYNKTAKFENLVPAVDAVISYKGTAIAIVTSAYDVYVPTQNIMGFDNPEFGLDIDRFGSAQITFGEGAPEINGFGALRIANSRVIAQYNFSQSALPDQFANTQVGTGSATYEADRRWVKLSVAGDASGGADNDLTTNTSHLYHPVTYGSTNLLVMGTRLPDAGVAGLVRNWGSFDATDGFMFRLVGTSLGVVHRHTFNANYVSANKTENFIAQADWNRDTLLGTGGTTNKSGVTLDVTKANAYWIDFQQLGGGTIRWGIFAGGERIICHEMDMGNGGPAGTWVTNAVANSARPICWAMKRIDITQDPGGPERSFYSLGATVWTDADVEPIQEYGKPGNFDAVFAIDENTTQRGVPFTQGAYYLTSLKPSVSYPNGQDNHTIYTPKKLDVNCFNQDGSRPDGEIRVFLQCILRGENFNTPSYSTLEYDGQNASSSVTGGVRSIYNQKGNHVGHGPEIFRVPISQGVGQLDMGDIFDNIQYGAVRPNAEAFVAFRSQPLANINAQDDHNAVGSLVGSTFGAGKVSIQVGTNPLNGGNVHFFEDRAPITITGVSGLTTGPETLTGTYYLSFIDGNEAFLYDSAAGGLTTLEDDRDCRVINFTPSTVPLGISEDDSCSVAGIGSAYVLDYDSDAGNIYLHGRTVAALDDTVAGGTAFTVASATNTSLLATTLIAINKTGVSNYPKDYKTTLGAVNSSGWSQPTLDVASIGNIRGLAPKSPVWTFMYNPIGGDDLGLQPGGASGPERTFVTFNLTWKELSQ